MARLYTDGAATTYDAAAAKFSSVSFSTYTPFDFGSDTAFANQADMSMAGQMRDCAECHVGGGAMEYLPRNAPGPVTNADGSVTYPELTGRVPLRSLNATYDATKFTAFNYFIDIYDEDGDSDIFEVFYQDYSQTGVLEMDCFSCHFEGYSWEARKDQVRKGRFDASRAVGAGLGQVPFVANVDVNGNLVPEYGRKVAYDPEKLVAVEENGVTVGYKLAPAVSAKIKGVPPSDNCASCHQATHNVDWKKRGEIWSAQADVHGRIGCMGCHERAEGSPVGTSGNAKDLKLAQCDPAKGGAGPWDNLMNQMDKVAFKDCEACHVTGKVGDTYVQTYGAPNPAAAHAAAGLSAQIVQTGRDGVANASHLDLISCEACHINKTLYNQIQDPVTGAWIDVITGGAFVDGTGPDHEGRLADHDSAYVERDMVNEDGTTNFGLVWSNDGKLHPGNFLTSFFWRDKNDIDYDVNADGRPGGMDAVLQTHVAKVLANDETLIGPLSDHGLLSDGTVTSTEVKEHISRLNTGLFSLNGQPVDSVSKVKLSFVTVPFQMSHQIGSADDAKGAGGCTDCHGAGKGFYNGTLNLTGKATIAWDSANDIVPMTMVNGATEKTHLHPNHKDKYRVRSIGRLLHTGGTLVNQDRSAYLYEDTFLTRDTSWRDTAITSGVVAVPDPAGKGAGTKGWLLKVEVCDTTGAPVDADLNAYCNEDLDKNGALDHVTPRTAQVGVNATNVAGVIAGLNKPAPATPYTDGAHGFTVTAATVESTDDGIVITPNTGSMIRLSPQTDVGYFNLAADLWKAAPVTPTVSVGFDSAAGTYSWDNDADGLIDGRVEMEAYLNAIGAELTDVDGDGDLDPVFIGIGVDPEAVVKSVALSNGDPVINNTVTDFDLVTFSAKTKLDNVNTQGTFTYSWIIPNYDYWAGNLENPSLEDATTEVVGDSINVSFAKQGSYQVVLKVQDEEGKVDMKVTTVTVKPAPVSANATVSGTVAESDVVVTFSGLPMDTTSGLDVASYGYDMLVVYWGDGQSDRYYADNNRDLLRDSLTGSGAESFPHAYATAGPYTVKLVLYVYDTATKKYVPIETDPSRESDITVL